MAKKSGAAKKSSGKSSGKRSSGKRAWLPTSTIKAIFKAAGLDNPNTKGGKKNASRGYRLDKRTVGEVRRRAEKLAVAWVSVATAKMRHSPRKKTIKLPDTENIAYGALYPRAIKIKAKTKKGFTSIPKSPLKQVFKNASGGLRIAALAVDRMADWLLSAIYMYATQCYEAQQKKNLKIASLCRADMVSFLPTDPN